MSFWLKLAIFIAFYAVFHAYILRPYIAGGVCTSQARMDGKTVIITGANTGIGKETAVDLARRGARVIMACRDMKKANAALKKVVEITGSNNVVAKHLDLASLKSVRAFAEDVNKNEPRLDVLINNAGVMAIPELTKTEDGFETQMGVNHLGHFLLTNLLIDLLKNSAPSRVVVVSSLAHWFLTKTGMNFENLNGEVSYDGLDAYGQSKLANILFARELSRRLKGTEVTANSLHPGAVASELGRHHPFWIQVVVAPISLFFIKSPVEGAQTNIHLAVSADVEGVSGLYFADCKERTPAQTAQDGEAARKLWEVSAKLVGLDATI